MKKFKNFLGRPVVTAALFALAILLLAGGTVGGTRAALTIESQYYNSEVIVKNIGVELVELDKDGDYVIVSGKDALMGPDTPIAQQIAADTRLLPGKVYPETLAVLNTGEINEYVRVSVFKYWVNEDGTKNSEMDSKWIRLGFVTDGGWTIDGSRDDDNAVYTGSCTEERTVLYYSDPIGPDYDLQTTPFLESVKIDDTICRKVSQSTSVENRVVDGVNRTVTVYTWTFIYNGKQFCIDVLVDGVQDHNVTDAKISAWGVDK